MHEHQGRRHEELYSRVFIPAVKALTFKAVGKTLCKKPQKTQNPNKNHTNKPFHDGVSQYFLLGNIWTWVFSLFCNRCHLHVFQKSPWFKFFDGFLENLLAIKYQIKHTFNFRLISCYSRFCLSLQSYTFGVPYHTFISFVCRGVLLDDKNNYFLLLSTSVYEKKNWFLHDQLCCSKQCQMLIAK